MLGYLLSPVLQIEDVNGLPLVNGKVYVYEANTSNLATIYSNYEGTLNTNPAILDLVGHTTIIADDEMMYDITVKDKDDNLLFSAKDVAVGGEGGSAIVTDVTVRGGGNGISVVQSVENNTKVFTVSIDYNFVASKTDLNAKQNVLTPGDNISISGDTISVTGLKTINVTAPLQKTETTSAINLSIDTSGLQFTLSAGTNIDAAKLSNGIVDLKSVDCSASTYSIAIGRETLASGDCSFAEGSNTSAIGVISHAEGAGTVASADVSHAEGNVTIAAGSISHAEGNGTSAIGYASHSEGIQTNAVGGHSHSEGSQTSAIGAYSHSEGINTVANADGSHAEGNGSSAMDIWSHAEGDHCVASGWHAHAEGSNTSAFGSNSHSMGSNTIASGTGSLAAGYNTSAAGYYTHTEGSQTYATDSYSHAEGVQTSATYYGSHAEGYRTLAAGAESHAEGAQTSAIGYECHSEGYKTCTIGNYSHAEGGNTSAIGDESHAEGETTNSVGYFSHAEGRSTSAVGDCSHSEGEGTIASGDYQTVIGKYNAPNTTDLFQIGCGTSDNNRRNVVEIKNDNTIWYNYNGTMTQLIPAANNYIHSEESAVSGNDYGEIINNSEFSLGIQASSPNNYGLFITPRDGQSRPVYAVVNGNYAAVKTVTATDLLSTFGDYDPTSVELFGWEIGNERPRWKYTIFSKLKYNGGYVTAVNCSIYRDQEYRPGV